MNSSSCCRRAGCEAEERRRLLQEAVAAISFRSADGRRVTLVLSAGAGVFPDWGQLPAAAGQADRRMYQDKARRKRTSRKGWSR